MKHLGALAVAVLSSISQAMCAQTGNAVDRLKACSRFEGIDRLKCVDEVLGEKLEGSDSAPPPGPNWIVSETTSPVDYEPQISAVTTARASSQDGPSSLAIRCRSRRTELLVSAAKSWKRAAGGEVRGAYRINEGPFVELRWRYTETGGGLAFQGDVVSLLRSMPDGGRIFVRVYAGEAHPYESTFELIGLDPVRRKIATACSWPQS
jgi:hypothetical protein